MNKIWIAALLMTPGLLVAKPVDILLDEKQPIAVSLSELHHNRISVVDGTIETIIGNPTFFDVDINDKLGHAFITLKQHFDKPQVLSIVTPSGKVQDLLISSEEIEPTTVFIEEAVEPAALLDIKKTLATPLTLCDIFNGKEPEGFHKRALYEDETIAIGEALLFHVRQIEVFEGALENLYLIRFKNGRRKPIRLCPSALQAEKVNWVFCPQAELLRYEETTIVLSKEKH